MKCKPAGTIQSVKYGHQYKNPPHTKNYGMICFKRLARRAVTNNGFQAKKFHLSYILSPGSFPRFNGKIT